MAYRITYGADKDYKQTDTLHPVRASVLSIVCGILFLTMAYRYWPEGRAVMDRVLSYDGWSDTSTALEGMALELRSGASLSDAVTAFCQEVIGGSFAVGA